MSDATDINFGTLTLTAAARDRVYEGQGRSILIKSDESNSENMRVGKVDVTDSDNGFLLSPGASLNLSFVSPHLIFAAGAEGDTISYTVSM